MEIEETDTEVLEASAEMMDDLISGTFYEKRKEACQEMGFAYKEIPKGGENG